MNKILVTGITGLVGSAFVVALLRERSDYEIVCLVRSGGGKSAEERVESIIRDECAFDSCPDSADAILRKIQVVEGDVATIVPTELAKNEKLNGVNIVFSASIKKQPFSLAKAKSSLICTSFFTIGFSQTTCFPCVKHNLICS